MSYACRRSHTLAEAPPLGSDHADHYLLTRVGSTLSYGLLPVVRSTLHRAAIRVGLPAVYQVGHNGSGGATRAQFLPSIILLHAATALPDALALYVYKQLSGRGVRLLVSLLLALSEWALAYSLKLVVTGPAGVVSLGTAVLSLAADATRSTGHSCLLL